MDDARVLMQSDARYNTVVGGQPLYLDYSSGPPGGSSTAGLGGTAPGGGAVALDWICDRCTSVNFSRCVRVAVGVKNSRGGGRGCAEGGGGCLWHVLLQPLAL